MGQKVHPTGFRTGVTEPWKSRWYASKKEFRDLLLEDFKVRRFLKTKYRSAAIPKVEIERTRNEVVIFIHTARPGMVIGKKGEDIEKLRVEAAGMMKMPVVDVRINIAEIRKPELDATLVAEGIAQQIEKRVMFRRAMKRAVTNTMRLGAQGVKIKVAGRLNGAEIARSEWYREGRVPLHTLRAYIDYGFAEANTTYGQIGIKVWLYKGERLVPQRGREEEYRERGPRRPAPARQ